MRSVVLLSSLLYCSVVMSYDDKKESSAEHAAAYWKSNVRRQQGKTGEIQTEHTLIYGTVDAKQLESIGKAAERAIVFAQKSVGYDKEMVKRPNQQMTDRPYHWEDKLIIFVCKERHEFNDLFYRLKQAKPEANEVSLYLHDKGRSYVLLGPTSQNRKLNNEVMVVEQAGAATLTRRHDPIPRWFAAAFGRMLAYKFDNRGFAAERSKIPVWAANLHVRDLMMDDNPNIEAGILMPLQTSLVECLAQSSMFKDDWFKILDETAYRNGNLNAALEELKFKLESVQIEWKDSLWKASGPRQK
ncbi:MAG TPA: hypothetical protein PLN21_19005 [Gemmatales bacterium]|nr:hypothetical protein [Gemmatales bacterium]